MKRNLKWLGLGGMIATAMLFATGLSANDFIIGGDSPYELHTDLFKSCMVAVEKDCKSWAKTGGGGEMPRWMPADTKVELAIGEKYILTGVIEFIQSAVFLHIDLKSQPWLANRTRVGNPYYRILDTPANWTKYRGKRLTIVGTSRYAVYNERGRKKLEIYIEPAADAVMDALQRR